MLRLIFVKYKSCLIENFITGDNYEMYRQLCCEEKCTKHASYNFKGERKSIYCSAHKHDGMVNVKNRTCIEPQCTKQPNFNFQGESKAIYCATHKHDGMVDIKNKTCITLGCSTRPIFNFQGESKAVYCATHKQDGMVDISHGTCSKPGCTKRPNFNIRGESKPMYCILHKQDNMINVIKRTCIDSQCTKHPNFNFYGESRAIYCATHKQDGMVDIIHRTCIKPGCKTQPAFNFQGGTSLYCTSHKQDGMVDIKNRTCNEQGCKKIPTFNFQGENKALYCVLHKEDGMVDIKHKTCIELGCKTRTSYGNHIVGKVHCANHFDKKTEWKVTVCTTKGCKSIACFSENGNYPYSKCEIHSSNLKSSLTGKCNSCNLSDLLLDEEGKCLLACTKLHSEYIKKTEEAMNSLFEQQKFVYTRDKMIEDGCSRRRPDFVFNLGSVILIVENDENQHKSRTCECEQTRMIQIHQEFNGLPVHFIRFNPDRYECLNKSEDQTPLIERHKHLVHIIKKIVRNPDKFVHANKNLTVTYLYYDKYNRNDPILNIHY